MENFQYNNSVIVEEMTRHLQNSSFPGLSVSLNNVHTTFILLWKEMVSTLVYTLKESMSMYSKFSDAFATIDHLPFNTVMSGFYLG